MLKKVEGVSWGPRRWCQYKERYLQVGFIYTCLGLGYCRTLNLYRSLLDFKYHRITIISRSREIQIMRLVGAKKQLHPWPVLAGDCLYWIVGSSSSINFWFTLSIIKSSNLLTRHWLVKTYHWLHLTSLIQLWSVFCLLSGICIGSLGSRDFNAPILENLRQI